MGDAALRVQTRYLNAEALLMVVGPSLAHGRLRVPIQVHFEQPFDLVITSLDGAEAVQGTAEVVEQAGDATWIRFMSAAPTGADTRCVLVDTEVISPASVAAKVDGFEAITAVNETPKTLATMPAGAAEAVPLLPPPPPPLDPLFDVSDASSSIAEAAAACDRESQTEGETTMVETSRDVEVAALAAVEGRFDALERSVDPERDLRIPHTGEGVPLTIEESRPTIESPALVADEFRPTVESPPFVATLVQMTTGDDAVAAERGMRAITSPYVRASSSRLPTSIGGRRLVIAAASVAAVSMCVAVASIMWARDAVARAEQEAPAVTVVEPPAPVVVEPPATVVETPPAVVEAPVAEPATCSLEITATFDGSSIYIDGKKLGVAPASPTVECGKPVTVEVRRARYESFKRTVTPTGREELRADLEREKTRLTVWSEPAGATVTYNRKPIGKTPLTVKIPRYEQGTLDFSMPGMQADWRRIVPKTAEKTVTIQLRKQ